MGTLDGEHDRPQLGDHVQVETSRGTIVALHLDEQWKRGGTRPLLDDLVTRAVRAAVEERPDPAPVRRDIPPVSSQLVSLRLGAALELNRQADRAMAVLTEFLANPDHDSIETRESSTGYITVRLRHGGFSSVSIDQQWAEAVAHRVLVKDLNVMLSGVSLTAGLPSEVHDLLNDVKHLDQELSALEGDVR